MVGALAAGAAGVGLCIGLPAACPAVAAAALKAVKPLLKFSGKINRQASKRGWTKEQIEKTVENAYTKAKTTYKGTGEPATAYINKDGSYVVIKDATKEIIQVSDKTRPWHIPQDWKWK